MARVSRLVNHDASWIVVAWVLLIVSGASTTGLLWASAANPTVLSSTFESHRIAGAALGLPGLVRFLRPGQRRDWTWLGAAVVTPAVVTGWLSARWFTPRTVAVHAFLAALAALALAGLPHVRSSTPGSPPRAGRRPKWMRRSARLAVGLVVTQVAVGALLRHQLINFMWHVAIGGVTVLALLVPAVAVVQDPSSPRGERRIAQWAIASVVAQVSLGGAVLLMLLIGPPSLGTWHAATIAHETVGTLTLLATAAFARMVSGGIGSRAPR